MHIMIPVSYQFWSAGVDKGEEGGLAWVGGVVMRRGNG
jgi:hypothetical protein